MELGERHDVPVVGLEVRVRREHRLRESERVAPHSARVVREGLRELSFGAAALRDRTGARREDVEVVSGVDRAVELVSALVAALPRGAVQGERLVQILELSAVLPDPLVDRAAERERLAVHGGGVAQPDLVQQRERLGEAPWRHPLFVLVGAKRELLDDPGATVRVACDRLDRLRLREQPARGLELELALQLPDARAQVVPGKGPLRGIDDGLRRGNAVARLAHGTRPLTRAPRTASGGPSAVLSALTPRAVNAARRS